MGAVLCRPGISASLVIVYLHTWAYLTPTPMGVRLCISKSMGYFGTTGVLCFTAYTTIQTTLKDTNLTHLKELYRSAI